MDFKKIGFISVSLVATLLVAGCAQGGVGDLVEMSYYDECRHEEGEQKSTYNKNLFYRNDKQIQVPDPCVYKITDRESSEYGYYYLYGTTGNNNCTAYRSKDLAKWEGVGTVMTYKDPYSDGAKSLFNDHWATEIIYDEKEDCYYMYTSASPSDSPFKYIPFIAKAKEPYGPFELIDHTSKYKWVDGTSLVDSPYYYFCRYTTFDPYKMYQAMSATPVEPDGSKAIDVESCPIMRGIDFHPFVDPVTQQKYLYFVNCKNKNKTFVMGMKMNSWTEPDYSSLKQLTYTAYTTTAKTEKCEFEPDNHINEGPWMNYHNGKYYLTLSINGYTDKSYSVVQAVGDTPLGDFRKLDGSEGGLLLSTDMMARDDVSGPGHHSIANIGSETFIIYHKHDDPADTQGGRHVNIDRLEWMTIKDRDGNDLDVMYCNGPTTSVQPLPYSILNSKNHVLDAKITATNIKKGSSTKALNDGKLSLYRYANEEFVENYIPEASFNKGTTITIDWGNTYRNIRALMIYNSKYVESSFKEIKRIEFIYKDKDGKENTKFIDHLQYNIQDFTNEDDEEDLRPGGAAVAEFNPIDVRKIKIYINEATKADFPLHGSEGFAKLALSEIVAF